MDRKSIIGLIDIERNRQEHKHPVWYPMFALQVLVEEVGEVATAQLEGDLNNLKEELVQVASVAIRWLENIK